MILPAGLLLLPFVLANLGFWDGLVPRGLAVWLGAMREDQSRLSHMPENPNDDDDDDDDDFGLDIPEYRLSTGSGSGSPITCWPSKGGIYKLPFGHIVQRQFLGLDRRTPNILRPEVSIEEEDAFCNQLRKLGARWWESTDKYLDDCFEMRPARDVPVLYIGWPASGGVWALHTDDWNATKNGYGIIYNSLTMEEQCETIKEFGGTFYQDPKDCPYVDLPEN